MQELAGAWIGWAWFPQTITQKNSKKNFLTKLLKAATPQQPRASLIRLTSENVQDLRHGVIWSGLHFQQ